MHRDSSSSVYHLEIERFLQRCHINYLVLKVKKTKSDPKAVGDLRPEVIHSVSITQIGS